VQSDAGQAASGQHRREGVATLVRDGHEVAGQPPCRSGEHGDQGDDRGTEDDGLRRIGVDAEDPVDQL
jgi:hypothetical protein